MLVILSELGGGPAGLSLNSIVEFGRVDTVELAESADVKSPDNGSERYRGRNPACLIRTLEFG